MFDLIIILMITEGTKEIFAGICAGMVAGCVSHPLDTVKIRI